MNKVKYNHRAIQKHWKAVSDAPSFLKYSRYAKMGGQYKFDRKPQLGMLLDHIEALMKLNFDNYIPREKQKFEREREECVKDIYEVYSSICLYYGLDYYSDGSEFHRDILDFLPENSDFQSWESNDPHMLDDHIVRVNNHSSHMGSYYYPKRAKINEPDKWNEQSIHHEVGRRRPESRELYNMFSTADPVAGGRKVTTKGRATTLPNDMMPNPVKERSGYITSISSGEIRVGYMNANGNLTRYTKSKEERMNQNKPPKFMPDVDNMIAELDREQDNSLLMNAKGYLEMSDSKFKDRIDRMEAEGLAILAEDERQLEALRFIKK